jgi:hypothetical protein
MSAQTGEEIPAAPASTRVGDRVRFRIRRWVTEPNPIWIRELYQSTRLARTPFILMAITVMVALAIAAIGGSASEREPSDEVGELLYQTFFSIGYFVVAWVGPGLAANAIASEREGRTWEAIVLTGLGPKVIARGKFLSAFSDVAAYIVMLAPVGALPFLFGGVHWLEVVIGFVYLFAMAALAVAFGLALSSKMPSSRGAILVTLLLSVPLSGGLYGMAGPGLSFGAHELWPQVLQGRPVWLPMAYVRADFGIAYALLLLLVPLIVFGLPGWLLYEATIANLTEASDDRSSGLKRWFGVASIVLVGAGLVTLWAIPDARGVLAAGVAEVVILLWFLGFATVMFAGEPLGPTRRVIARWQRAGASRLTRFFGPGLARTLGSVVVVGLIGFVVIVAAALLRAEMVAKATLTSYGDMDSYLLAFSAYAIGFFVFTVGLATWLRARSNNVTGSRIVFLALVFGISIVPWIGAAIIGLASRSGDAVLVAAPSPFYAILLLKHQKDELVLAGLCASIAWGVFGTVLFGSARRRVRSMVTAFDEQYARAEAALAAEEAAIAAAAEPEGAPVS